MCYKNEYQKRAHGEVEQIFRELLPEAGLHVREEQIRLCHEMLDALMKNEITLCDAGVGIGKTYAYLTPASRCGNIVYCIPVIRDVTGGL